MQRYKLIALFGPSGAGKDTLLNYITNAYPAQFHKVVSYTTRMKREGEKEGEDYYFISPEDFTNRVLQGTMLEATEWGGEFYGSDISTFNPDKINIEVLDERGIECLIDHPDIELYPIFIAIEPKARLIRVLNREENPDCEKICKRFLEDLVRFNKEFDFHYNLFYNGNGIQLSTFEDALENLGLLSKNA